MLIQEMAKGKLMPLWYWRLTQFLKNKIYGNKSNSLSPSESELECIYENKSLNTELQNIINLDQSNKWTLDAEVLNFLWEELNHHKPNVIFEFGSGTSTVLFMHYFSKYPTTNFTLYTIDQDNSFLSKTIESIHVPKNVDFKPIYVEVDKEGFKLEELISKNIFANIELEFILIDAPFGGWMIRKNTIPSILKYCANKAVWFLDDAFRDSEIQILRKWKSMKSIKIEGIINIGKGLGKGLVRK
ncbi:hypothetical protein GCM10011506_30410 [Marivirga lumbricoides]|uniref:Class I SAM-dependent methyltransferase n=1 Tax=Marivirga lumbricoides TaxID=1046115 RepID=A0ABQ1MMC5_9BACT|nr:hypothetical protein GCM10011506_30410 [Marivirga lumbricoides]